jgi:hypothetical protein
MAKSPLQKTYDIELNQIDEDVEYLETRFDDHTEQIKQIEDLSRASDASYAQTVVIANSYLQQAVNFGEVAVGCGCSIGVTADVPFESARAKMTNVNINPNYGGNDPNEDQGTVPLTEEDSSGNTTLNPVNYGKGYQNTIRDSSETATLKYVAAIQPNPGICTQTCSELYTLQQQALTDLNTARASPDRTQYGTQSGIIKDEAQEYRNQRWALRKGKKNTEERRQRIVNFYPNAGPGGIGT